MNANLERLLHGGALTRNWRKDPLPVPAIVVTYAGAGSATLELRDDGMLVIQGVDGADSFQVDTLPATLAGVAGAFLVHAGYGAVLSNAATSQLSAAVLIGEPSRPITAQGITVSRFTNPNWRLFQAIAKRLDLTEPDLDAAIDQLNLLKAAGYFADFWGTLTGTLRNPGETDDDFVARQLHELIRPRSNNQSLATLLEEDDPGSTVQEVTDLEPKIFRCSATPLRGYFLAGDYYNASSFEVVLAEFGSLVRLAYLVGLNKAAGTTGFVIGRLLLEGRTSSLRFADVPIKAGSVPPMQIGVGQIGVGQIGP
jgi:hypothetical protein